MKGLYKLGGVGFVVSGLLFLSRYILDRMAGPLPGSGAGILLWATSGKVVLALANEVLFFAAIALVPAVVALYYCLDDTNRAWAVTGCGIMAAAVPVVAVLDIVHGRLVYPIHGMRVDTPAVAEFVATVFYGGLHAVGIMLGVATLALSLVMNRRDYWKRISYLGATTAVADVIGAYPDAIGPGLTLACQLLFAAWFVAVGSKLYRLGLSSSAADGRTR